VTDEEFAALPPIINLRDYGLSWDWIISKTTFRAAIESQQRRESLRPDKPENAVPYVIPRSMHDLTDEEKTQA
jgi:hypothetical protein